MLEPNRIQRDVYPQTIQKLGNGTYYYNYDIKEIEVISDESTELEKKIETQYNFIQVYLVGQPDYKKCIQAVIRSYLSTEDELSLINKYNKHLMGLIEDSDAYNNYLEYVNLVSKIQTKVKEDFGIKSQPKTNEELIPSLRDITNLTKILIKTATLSDQEALQCKSLYPSWDSYVGKSLNQGDKITYGKHLYKVRQAINPVLDNQPPSTYTASLYEEIVEDHAGTLEDPIPYNTNQELFEGKYYSQNGVTYKCIRNSGQPLYNNLSDLVGNYVQNI